MTDVKHRSGQSGNVLFLILIAVALFAALSYAVTQSSRSGGEGIAKDKAKLYAAQFVQYGTSLEQAIMRMRLAKVPEHGFDMASSVTHLSAANATCTTNLCKLFHIEGGGISPDFLDDKAFDKSLPSASGGVYRRNIFRTISVVDVGSDLDELVLIIHGLDKTVCTLINKSLGIQDGGNPPTEGFTGYAGYHGTLTTFPEGTGELGEQAAIFEGKQNFCAYFDATYGYTYYHVLMSR